LDSGLLSKWAFRCSWIQKMSSTLTKSLTSLKYPNTTMFLKDQMPSSPTAAAANYEDPGASPEQQQAEQERQQEYERQLAAEADQQAAAEAQAAAYANDQQHAPQQYGQGNAYGQQPYESAYANPVIPSGATAPPMRSSYGGPGGRGGAPPSSQPISSYSSTTTTTTSYSSAAGARRNPATSMDLSIFRTPRGILRLVVWTFALMTFAIMSSQAGYSSVSELQFVMAMAIMCWLWETWVIGTYIFQYKVNNYPYVSFQPMLELIMDVIWFVLVFISFCVGANKCQESVPGGHLCSNAPNAQGALAMDFFTAFALGPSIYFSILARRDGQWQSSKSTSTNISVNVTVIPGQAGPGGQGQIV